MRFDDSRQQHHCSSFGDPGLQRAADSSTFHPSFTNYHHQHLPFFPFFSLRSTKASLVFGRGRRAVHLVHGLPLDSDGSVLRTGFMAMLVKFFFFERTMLVKLCAENCQGCHAMTRTARFLIGEELRVRPFHE
jgi:hypothetical protein